MDLHNAILQTEIRGGPQHNFRILILYNSLVTWQQTCLQNFNTMRRYNPNVRIGNWYDELILEEEKAKQYSQRNKNSKLKVQKARQLFLDLLKEIPLTVPVVGLCYGAVIQIIATDEPQKTLFRIPEKQGLALSAHIPWDQIDSRTSFAKDDLIIASGLITPCVRNVWMLIPHDKSKKGKEVRYGDSIHIQLYNKEKKFYIEALTLFPFAPSGESGHIVPKLNTYKSTETRFKIQHIDPNCRFASEGKVVRPFEKVSIILGNTNEALAAETDFWFPSYFGVEFEVSIFNYKTEGHPAQPSTKNFWSFVLHD